VIEILNGSSVVRIDFANVNTANSNSWISKNIQVANFITITATMQIRLRTMDIGAGHLVEAGFDNFKVIENSTLSVSTSHLEDALLIYPNPFSTEINIKLKSEGLEELKIEVLDLAGRLIDQKEFYNTSTIRFINAYQKGIYLMKIYGNGKLIKTEKLIKL
jgi:hypothetical protein